MIVKPQNYPYKGMTASEVPPLVQALNIVEKHVVFRRVLLRKEKMMSGAAYNEQVMLAKEKLASALEPLLREPPSKEAEDLTKVKT